MATNADTNGLDERAYSIAETCELLGGISRRTFYAELSRGHLEARKVGRRTVVLQSEIARYLNTLPTAGVL